MKTNTKAAQALAEKSVKLSLTRARARAREKQNKDTKQARQAARELFVVPQIEERARAARPPIIATSEERACARRLRRWEAEEVRAGGAWLPSVEMFETYQAAQRLRARAEAGDDLVWIDKETGALVVDTLPEDAEGKRQSVASAPLGAGVVDMQRPRMEKLARVAASAIGDGHQRAVADEAAAALLSALGDETRARAARLFRAGQSGRIHARAVRVARAMARRWARRHWAKLALALREVGGAAGVDDLGAGQDRAREAEALAVAIHCDHSALALRLLGMAEALRPLGGRRAPSTCILAACAPSLRGSALPAPCAAILARAPLPPILRQARALAALSPLAARSAMFGRGTRPQGKPLVIWSDAGRQIAPESFGVQGRGRVWKGAAIASARALAGFKYRADGRDGREVSAPEFETGAGKWTWEAEFSNEENESPADGWELITDKIPLRVNRRPSALAAIRSALAANIRDARAAVGDAKAAALAAEDLADRIALGGALGRARRALAATLAKSRALSSALAGEGLPDSELAAWVGEDGKLKGAGRMFAARFRAANPDIAKPKRATRAKAAK